VASVLFDHNVPEPLRRVLAGHEVRTAAEMGWAAISNGDLLTQAEAGGFAVLVTADRNMRHQQNLAGRKIALVVLPTNRWKTVREHAERIAQAVDRAKPGSLAEVEFEMQPRSPRRPKGPGP
jgi:hypothetical protein